MKKADIREGVTYRNKGGNSARQPTEIVTGAHGTEVKYKQVHGPYAGSSSSLSLDAFASWAHSEDTGAPESVADLRARNAKLCEALSEAVRQIEYLHEKFQETGSGNAVLARARDALA